MKNIGRNVRNVIEGFIKVTHDLCFLKKNKLNLEYSFRDSNTRRGRKTCLNFQLVFEW